MGCKKGSASTANLDLEKLKKKEKPIDLCQRCPSSKIQHFKITITSDGRIHRHIDNSQQVTIDIELVSIKSELELSHV